MTAQQRLLELQRIDSALAQLLRRQATLPERSELSRIRSEQGTAGSDLVGAQTTVSDLELEQERAEADLDPVRQRLSRNEQRIADGTVGDPKALSSMVEEVAHLRRRIATLEDAELEVMEQLETAVATRQRLTERVDALAGQAETATGKLAAKVRELAEQAEQQRAQREELLPELPADLLALYVKIAAGHGGVGAAELRQRRCTGCQLEVNAAELRAYAAAPAEEVLRCEECSRILIRTAESGL